MKGLNQNTRDFLLELCHEAKHRVMSGYYDVPESSLSPPLSLRKGILNQSRNAIIAEIKLASPSVGGIKVDAEPGLTARAMAKGGAAGISVITEPSRFMGSLDFIKSVKSSVTLPVLMKDFIVSAPQIRAARLLGADAVLLIVRAFKLGYTDMRLCDAISLAHDLGLEVLLEACNREELIESLDSDADLVGVNSRDLSTMQLRESIFEDSISGLELRDRIVVAESGIDDPGQVRRLRDMGYRAFLVGTSIMRAEDIEAKVRELVEA